MEIVSFENYQTHYCDICNEWLEFGFFNVDFLIEEVIVHLKEYPMLHCKKCKKYFLSQYGKRLIREAAIYNKEHGFDYIGLSLKKEYTEKYDYFCKINFLYDYIDYKYIPGLLRSNQDGFLTPVFFNLSVLNKYPMNPDYRLDFTSLSSGKIEKGDEFYIAFGINKSKKVFMWLGDIG